MQNIKRDLTEVLEYIDLSARVDTVSKLIEILGDTLLGISNTPNTSEVNLYCCDEDTVEYEITTLLAMLMEMVDHYKQELATHNLPNAIDIISAGRGTIIELEMTGDEDDMDDPGSNDLAKFISRFTDPGYVQ